eukprot:1196011-Prorocentrum_minimum.AAC.4
MSEKRERLTAGSMAALVGRPFFFPLLGQALDPLPPSKLSETQHETPAFSPIPPEVRRAGDNAAPRHTTTGSVPAVP